MRAPFARWGRQDQQIAELRENAQATARTEELLRESIAGLEAQIRQPGWMRMAMLAETEFTREGLRDIAVVCRLMALKNPLIIRAVALHTAYIWAQGVEISARANGQNKKNRNEQDVNQVVQDFLADESNQRTLTGEEARVRNARSERTDGNLFYSLFTSPTSGRVLVRLLPFDEIAEVVTNTEDKSEPWYYRRKWTKQTLNPVTGQLESEAQEVLYPAVGYRPKIQPESFGSVKVRWDAPVVHKKVNDPEGWQFGVGDVYAAVDWAQAYKEFLTDWARLMKSLSRYAWKAKAPSAAAASVRARMAQIPGVNADGEIQSAGATAVMTPDMALEAVSKSGATLDSDSGRPIAAMVAATLGVPVTMLLGDPGVTGARATAETLDQPTELGMQLRQGQEAAVLRRILGYVIDAAVRAPKGPLKGKITRDEDGREVVTLDGDTDRTIDISWPDLDDIDPQVLVEAITKANATGTVPAAMVLRLLLQALGVRDVDEIVAELVDENGKFLWPNAPPINGQQAADAARNGQDPAETGAGSMSPDDEPADAGGDASGDQPADPEAPS